MAMKKRPEVKSQWNSLLCVIHSKGLTSNFRPLTSKMAGCARYSSLLLDWEVEPWE